MRKKITALLMMLLAVTLLMGGCGASAPKTAKDLLKRNQSKSPDNFHFIGDITMDMNASAEGYDIPIPFTMKMDMDVYRQNSHGTATVNMEIFGQSVNTTTEMYTVVGKDGTTAYSREENSDSWTKSTEDYSGLTELGSDMLNNVNFDSGEMVHDEKAGTYTVKIKMRELLKNEEYRAVLKEYYTGTLGTVNMGEEQIEEMLTSMEEADVTYVFNDKDYTLTNAKIENMSYKADVESAGVRISMSVDQDMDYKYSDYGKIKEESVTVPEEVLESAGE